VNEREEIGTRTRERERKNKRSRQARGYPFITTKNYTYI
jgi:hypothetical protein